MDFGMYANHNIMAVPLAIVVLLFLNMDLLGRKKAVSFFGYTVLIVNMIYYGIRTFL